MLDQLDASPEDFVHVSSHTRYDPMPMHDMGFRNLVLLDRGCDPVTHGYGLTVTVKSLDDLNTMLGSSKGDCPCAPKFDRIGRAVRCTGPARSRIK